MDSQAKIEESSSSPRNSPNPLKRKEHPSSSPDGRSPSSTPGPAVDSPRDEKPISDSGVSIPIPKSEYETGRIVCEGCGSGVLFRDDESEFTLKHWQEHRKTCAAPLPEPRLPSSSSNPSSIPNPSVATGSVTSVMYTPETTAEALAHPPTKRRRAKRTEEERVEYLRADPYVAQFEAYRVLCASCDKWIRLRPNSTYCSIPWDAHRKSCLAKKMSGKNIYALDERNSLFSKDPDVRKFDAERVLCAMCDRWIAINPDDHLEAVQRWLQHRSSCGKVASDSVGVNSPMNANTMSSIRKIASAYEEPQAARPRTPDHATTPRDSPPTRSPPPHAHKSPSNPDTKPTPLLTIPHTTPQGQSPQRHRDVHPRSESDALALRNTHRNVNGSPQHPSHHRGYRDEPYSPGRSPPASFRSPYSTGGSAAPGVSSFYPSSHPSHPSHPSHSPHPNSPSISAQNHHHLNMALSSTAHESRRRNAEQRCATLQADTLIRSVEPNRVFCSLCLKWVQLRQDSSYCAYPWLQHRGKCLARSQRRKMKEREIAEIKAKAGKRPLSNPHSISISNGRHEAPPPASHPSLMTRGGYSYHHHQQQQRPHEQQHHPHHSHHPQRSTHAYTYEYAGSKRARPDESMSDVDEDVPPRWRAAPRRQGGSPTGSGRSVSPSDDEDRDAEGDADDADGDAPESEEGVDDGGKEKRGSSWAGRKRGANGDGEEQGDNQSADADADGDGDAELDADADGDDDVEASMDVMDVDADMDVDVVSAQPHASQSRGSRAHNTRTQSHHAQAGHQHHHRQEHEMRSRREEDSRMRSVMSRGHRSPMIGASRQPMAIAGCLADLDSQYGRKAFVAHSIAHLFSTTYDSHRDDLSISALLAYLNTAMPADKHEDFDTGEVVKAVVALRERGKVRFEGDMIRV